MLLEDFTSYKSTVPSWFSLTMSACENNPSEVLYDFSKKYCLAFGFFLSTFESHFELYNPHLKAFLHILFFSNFI